MDMNNHEFEFKYFLFFLHLKVQFSTLFTVFCDSFMHKAGENFHCNNGKL